MIYTRQQVDYWRINFKNLNYIHDNWGKSFYPGISYVGRTINIYKDSMYLNHDQFFIQVL